MYLEKPGGLAGGHVGKKSQGHPQSTAYCGGVGSDSQVSLFPMMSLEGKACPGIPCDVTGGLPDDVMGVRLQSHSM